MKQDPVADAAVAQAKLENAGRERDAARARLNELQLLVSEMLRVSERGCPDYLKVVSHQRFSEAKWQRMAELISEAGEAKGFMAGYPAGPYPQRNMASLKAEIARLDLRLRGQSEAFIRRVQDWATKLRNRSLILSADNEAYRPAGLEMLLVEMLRYSGEPAPAPSPDDVKRAHERLKQLQEGAAQVAAAAAEGRPR